MSLTTKARVFQQLGLTDTASDEGAFAVTLGYDTETTANVETTASAFILTPTGGSGSDTATVDFATYTTIQAVVDRINTLGTGNKWSAELCRDDIGTLASDNLKVASAVELSVSNPSEIMPYDFTAVVTDGAFIDNLILEVDEAIAGYTGRQLEQATGSKTDLYDGHAQDELYLRNYPVASTPTISLVAVDGTEKALTSGTDFRMPDLNGPEVLWIGGGAFDDCWGYPYRPWRDTRSCYGGWPKGTKNIKVVSTPGYATVPADLEGIARRMVVGMFLNRTRNPAVAMRQHANTNTTYVNVAEALEAHKNELARYKRRLYG